MNFFGKTNIDFLGKRRTWFIASIIISLICLILPFFGVRYGIDFTGGTEGAVAFKTPVATESVREAMTKAGFGGSEIKDYGEKGQYLIRVGNEADAPERMINGLKTAFPDNQITILKMDKIGPKVGSELRTQALLAVFLSIVAILLYVAFRFEFVYGLGAIIAIVHDVIVAIGAVVIVQKLGLFNLDADQSVLAALLTVIGFSINDTVIIFDRIRENKEKHKTMPLIPLMNLSLNETLSRTINTVLTVAVVLLVMIFFGGDVLRGFSFVMFIGIVVGSYSSIYIASGFVVWYYEHVKKVNVESGSASAVEATAKSHVVKL
ncbi:MAG: protein translocase subunit SecF [Bacteroidota bacterium]